MSTRSVIARKNGDSGFVGVYHHWDGYPRGLGQELVRTYRSKYQGKLDEMLEDVVDKHPAGWSSFLSGECFCHGRNPEGENFLTDKTASGCGCEYAYVFCKQDGKDTMLILSSYTKAGGKMIGMFGMGDENATWKCIGSVDLCSGDVDWNSFK